MSRANSEDLGDDALQADSGLRGAVGQGWVGAARGPLRFVGSYLSAHVFDEIAPKLRDTFHASAVTRRGIGASDAPSVGYDRSGGLTISWG